MNTMLRPRAFPTLALLAAAVLMAACAASPRTRPLHTSPVSDAADSTQSVRRQLQGRWTLVSFETYPSAGQVSKLDAVGELTYDEYGNLVIRAALTGAPSGELAKALRYSGRAVIDAQNRRLVLQALEGQGGEALPAAVAADNVRYYEFDGDLLRLTTKDSGGRPTAVITWKKAQ